MSCRRADAWASARRAAVGMGVLSTHGSRRQEIRWVSPADAMRLREYVAELHRARTGGEHPVRRRVHSAEALPNGCQSSSVMLEVRRDVYVDETALTLNDAGLGGLQRSLQRLVDALC
jgi:hypothetical protein